MHQRRYTQHRHYDHSQASPENFDDFFTTQSFHAFQNEEEKLPERLDSKGRTGKASYFPSKLHKLLEHSEQSEIAHIISWQVHGRAFKIHKPKEFTEKVGPVYFQQTKLASFRRQLYFYGFLRISQGPDKGSYYHEFFLRGKAFLTKRIACQRGKGNRVKDASNLEQEPDFYNMPFMDNIAKGQNEPPSASASHCFGSEVQLMLDSSKWYLTAKWEGINPTSCCFPGSSSLKKLLRDKENREEFNIHSCFKIQESLHDEWDLDTFSFADTILHDTMKDNSYQEEDIWSLP